MIYVLVPAFDEAATVGLILWKVRQVFTAFNREYQLLVVNDGSTDATDQVLAPYTRALPLTLDQPRRPQRFPALRAPRSDRRSRLAYSAPPSPPSPSAATSGLRDR